MWWGIQQQSWTRWFEGGGGRKAGETCAQDSKQLRQLLSCFIYLLGTGGNPDLPPTLSPELGSIPRAAQSWDGACKGGFALACVWGWPGQSPFPGRRGLAALPPDRKTSVF